MQTFKRFVVAAVHGSRPALRALLALLLAAPVLAACSTARTATSMLEARTPPPEALPVDDAVASLTGALIAHAQLGLPSVAGTYQVVVDPWIDRVTGDQSATTRAMELRIGEVVRERFPLVEPLPFTQASLARHPLIVIGAINAVTGPGEVTPATGRPGAYRIWGVIGDLNTGRVISREQAWVRAADVDVTPAAFFRDSPTWMPEPANDAYLRTSLARRGDPIDPEYLNGLQATALLADGTQAYEAGRYAEALNDFQRVETLPNGEQLRTYNGVYLASQALGQPAAAEAAFGRLVELGLARGQLAVKFVFQPGSTAFWPDPAVSGSYPLWLRQIALRTAASQTCLELRGYTSQTGSAAANDRLSLARANLVRARLVHVAPELRDRLTTVGAGGREPIVGSGADDASDVLDRRVELRPVPCAGVVAAGLGGTEGLFASR